MSKVRVDRIEDLTGVFGVDVSSLATDVPRIGPMFTAVPTSIWAYEDQVIKPNPGDPLTWDWSAAAQAMLDHGGNVIIPQNVTVTVKTPLQVKSNTQLTIDGTLKFANQASTLSSDHLIVCGGQGDPRVNVTINGVGTVDGNYQNRQSFAPVSGAYLFLARETTRLRIMSSLKWINAPSSAIAGVACNDVIVAYNNLRQIREHGIYFSTDSTGVRILFNDLNDLGVDGAYSADTIKLRNNCSNFTIAGNTLNLTPLTTPLIVRGVVLDESDNVSPIVHAVCHDGKIHDNDMRGLSTGIWLKGALIDAASADSLFDMRVTISQNNFEAKATSPLFAAILDRVRGVTFDDNSWSNFNAGLYGGGVGDIKVRRCKIKHAAGINGYGIRMLDTNYNDIALASRARGDVVLLDNDVSGYNAGGVVVTVANAYDEIKRNRVVSAGRAIAYNDYALSSAPTSGTQIVDLSDNPRLVTTGGSETAVFLNSMAALTVQYMVADNVIKSPSIGLAFSIVQDSSVLTNQIDAPTPISVGSGSRVYRSGNYNAQGPLGYTLTTTASYTLLTHESGLRIANVGATVIRTYSLPAATPGLRYTVLRIASFAIRVAPTAGQFVRGGGAGKYIQLNADGDLITLECVVAGTWEVVDQRGTPTFEA